jgi:adenosine kinase
LKSPEIWNLVEQAKVYYIGGYHLTVCVPAILALGEEAAAKDKVSISTKSGIWKSFLINTLLRSLL